MIDTLIHLALLVAMPPFLLGVINKTKALFAGRNGPPLLQVYYDLFKLLRKGAVLSSVTTWIFVAAPAVLLVTTAFAGLLVPLGSAQPPLSFAGDMVLFASLFALGRFFLTAAALDTGSAFEGMGAAREATFACLTEPALYFALMALAKISGTLSLSTMLHAPALGGAAGLAAPLALVAVGLFVVLLAENCRIPVDDPNTHLELTMIHEVMVLDHSGPLLGLIQYAAAMKFFVLAAFFLHVAVPFSFGHAAADWGLFVVLVLGVAVLVGVVESVMARLQMRHVPHLLIAALLCCAFGFVLLVR